MKTKLTAAFAALCLALSVAPLLAHHSTAAEYETSKTIQLQGAVTRVEWMNPHARAWIDVKAGGTTVSWELELSPPKVLTNEGLSQTFIKPGDPVSVTLWPAKDGSRLGCPLTMTLPDGRVLNLPRSGNWMPFS